LVDPLGSYVPSLRISVCGSSERHGSDLALDARLEASTELYHKSPGISVSGVGDQGQESIQVVVHHPVSLIIRGAFQSVNSICFRIDRKELAPELLFEVDPGLDGKDAGVRFLAKEVLRPPCSCSSLKKARVHKIFSLSQLNCSGARRRYNVQELKKARPELCLPEKLGGEGSFSLVRCLDGVDGTGKGGLTGGGDMGIGGRATVGGGAGPVIS